MTPSARIHTGRMQIFFGGSAAFGTRGQHAVDFPITNTTIESTLAVRYGDGLPVASVWNGDYKQDVVLKGEHADYALPGDLEDELIPVLGGLSSVPLRQVADVVPMWQEGQIVRRNGSYSVTVGADLERGENGTEQMTASGRKKLSYRPQRIR